MSNYVSTTLGHLPSYCWIVTLFSLWLWVCVCFAIQGTLPWYVLFIFWPSCFLTRVVFPPSSFTIICLFSTCYLLLTTGITWRHLTLFQKPYFTATCDIWTLLCLLHDRTVSLQHCTWQHVTFHASMYCHIDMPKPPPYRNLAPAFSPPVWYGVLQCA